MNCINNNFTLLNISNTTFIKDESDDKNKSFGILSYILLVIIGLSLLLSIIAYITIMYDIYFSNCKIGINNNNNNNNNELNYINISFNILKKTVSYIKYYYNPLDPYNASNEYLQDTNNNMVEEDSYNRFDNNEEFNISSIEEGNSDELNGLSCTICMEDFKPGEIVAELHCNCNSRYHPECIKNWSNKQSNPEKSCPACRTPLTFHEI